MTKFDFIKKLTRQEEKGNPVRIDGAGVESVHDPGLISLGYGKLLDLHPLHRIGHGLLAELEFQIGVEAEIDGLGRNCKKILKPSASLNMQKIFTYELGPIALEPELLIGGIGAKVLHVPRRRLKSEFYSRRHVRQDWKVGAVERGENFGHHVDWLVRKFSGGGALFQKQSFSRYEPARLIVV